VTTSLPRLLLAAAGPGIIGMPDQRDRDKASVERSTLEALLSMGTHIDKAVITAITPIAYQSRMSSGERCRRLRLRIGHPLVDIPARAKLEHNHRVPNYISGAAGSELTPR
jgi:hypothetical protein